MAMIIVFITDLSPDCKIPLAVDASAIVFTTHPIPSALLDNLTPSPCSVGTVSTDITICFKALPNIVNKL